MAKRGHRRRKNRPRTRPKKKVRPQVKYNPDTDEYYYVYGNGRVKLVTDEAILRRLRNGS